MSYTLTTDIYADIANARIVKSLNSTEQFDVSQLYQYDVLQFRLFPVVFSVGSVVAPFYTLIDLTALALKIIVGTREGSKVEYAKQDTWTKQTTADADGLSGYFYGALNLNTVPLNTAIGTSSGVEAYFQVAMGDTGNWRTAFCGLVRINAVPENAAGSNEAPAGETVYLAMQDALELFVRWQNNPAGRSLTLFSEDGTHARALGVRNDGTPQDDII